MPCSIGNKKDAMACELMLSPNNVCMIVMECFYKFNEYFKWVI